MSVARQYSIGGLDDQSLQKAARDLCGKNVRFSVSYSEEYLCTPLNMIGVVRDFGPNGEFLQPKNLVIYFCDSHQQWNTARVVSFSALKSITIYEQES